MLDNPVAQTAVGLILVFLGLSLMVTAVQELIASAVKLRAVALSAGLKEMLAQGEQGLDFYRKLMKHPVVTPAGERPSYISAQQFSTATLHILNTASIGPTAMQPLRIAVLNLPDAPYRTVLVSPLREGDDNVEAFETRLQIWFDQSMDRVSGIYKRWSQCISFAIGVVLAFLLRADTLAIAHKLWSEPYLRSGVVAQATALTKGAQSLNSHLPSVSQVAPSLLLLNSGETFVWQMLPGLMITAAAVTLGAPFWFDLLQSFVSVRGTGPTPTKANKK